MKTFEQIAKEVYPDVDGYLDQIEHDRIQFIRGLEYSGQQTKELQEQLAIEKMANKDTIDSYNVIIHELQEQLSQKEFELKAADHVLAEKEKEIESNEAIEFAEWLRMDWRPLAPNKNDWSNNKTKDIIKTKQLYEIFKNLNK